jgi:hypothetical protein
MGNVIHMETEEVRAAARQLVQVSENIQQEIASLAARIRALNWQSPGRDIFINDINELQRKIEACAEQGVSLGLRVQNEVDEWEQAASALVAGGLTPEQKLAQAITDSRQSIQTKWEKMTFDERKTWLKDYYKNLCAELGMAPVKFKVEDLKDPKGKDWLGVYSPGIIFGLFRSMTVDIDNVKGNDPFTILDTVAHETRHQYQHYLVEHPDQRPADISEDQIKAWKENFDNYKRAEDDFEAYRNQPVEKDAREFGEKAMQAYVESRAEVI